MNNLENDSAPHKSDDAKGENTAKNSVDKAADEAAKKSKKTEHNYDKKQDLFTK